jgi:twinkle protein
MLVIEDSIDFDAYLTGGDENAKVRPASEYADAVIERLYSNNPEAIGCRLPWQKTEDLFRIRPGEVTIWPGINGHGKSMLVGQVMISLMCQHQRVCIASMEMKPVATMMRMCRQALGADRPTEEYIRKFSAWTDGKLWLYDQQGTVASERLLAVIHYAAKELGVTQFVIDSLMKCGINEDDLNGQKRFIDKLCAAAKDTQCHVHLIAHSRKGQDELSPPGKMDVRGSASITDQVDNVLTVWRNKKKEQDIEKGKASPETLDAPDAVLICDKQRHGEWEGRIALWFDKPSFRYKGSQNDPVRTLGL